jgi:hypothetical protein
MRLFSKSGFPSVSIRVHLWTKILVVFSLLYLAVACSVPNLESATCVESRNALREFYSFHFGNNMSFTQDDLRARERFLTPEFAEKLRSSREGTDPFTTGTDDLPKAFRAGDCREISPERTAIEVVLFWKDDTRSEERKIKVEMAKRGDVWLVDNITQ